ncbi:ATP-dependent DNA helicase [Enhygromyxa salina]|uniref:ATP-dependent DNA helicase n=1 Tax=Enhygromyxa salina TaxID=215803 RepID=A0A0C2D528_9BACT|nr:ATP-binding protein [Enhygromyxa salina]KIG16790.1 ATP-dependent DNA helicase [Enhygromyxa salina]
MQWSDVEQLLAGESSTIEWKRNVADPEDVAKTLTAFANDIEQRGGGVVVCGVDERTDAEGAPMPIAVGLAPSRVSEIRGRVLALLRDRSQPPIVARLEVVDLPGDPARKVLVFRVDASPHAVIFRHSKHGTHHFIRVDDDTERANGRLAELHRLKGDRPLLMEDIHPDATAADLDRLVVRGYLEGLKLPQQWETYLEPGAKIEGHIPSLVTTRSTGGVVEHVPRNFALLLFGVDPSRFFPGARAVLSAYPGTDRAAARSDLVPDVTGPLPQLIRKVVDWLGVHMGMAVDKSETVTSGLQNRPRYSRRAVEEAVVNAFVHRDYSVADPVRVTVFEDRLEITSPGGLLREVSADKLREGRGVPSWRNEALANFMLRLGMAQNRGEGIPVMVRETRELTGHPPTFEFDPHYVTVSLPALRPRVGGLEALAPPADGGHALLLIAIGAPSIREQVSASLPELHLAQAPPVLDHASPGYLDSVDGGWEAEARAIRDALRAVVDRPEHRQFHLFYRGPVVLAPLIGAIIAPTKPLHVYTFENGRYVFTHTVDKKFLRG